MIVSLLVKLLGGVWNVRQLHGSVRSGLLRRSYASLYFSALRRKGSWISLSAAFGGEPCFPHGIYGIFISGGAVIGRNCVIFQHAMIGSNTLSDSGGMGAPRIGDDCYIGAGAKIVGDIIIGHSVRIGANSFVYQDVSDNSVVTSGTPRIVRMKRRLDNKFYHKHKGNWTYFDDGKWLLVEDPKRLASLDAKFSRKSGAEGDPL